MNPAPKIPAPVDAAPLPNKEVVPPAVALVDKFPKRPVPVVLTLASGFLSVD